MKSIKLYLNLALSIAFCVSINILAMENLARKPASGPTVKIGWRQSLSQLTSLLKDIDFALTNDKNLSARQREKLTEIRKETMEDIQNVYDMSSGIKPSDQPYIAHEINRIRELLVNFYEIYRE